MNLEQRQEHIRRIDEGGRAKNFLDSSGWKDFIKPIFDSFVRGLVDVREIESAKLESDKRASIEIKARKLAAEYIESIQKLIEGYVIDGDVSKTIVERENSADDLYKEIE